jgi:hypothetical protein
VGVCVCLSVCTHHFPFPRALHQEQPDVVFTCSLERILLTSFCFLADAHGRSTSKNWPRTHTCFNQNVCTVAMANHISTVH